jgi:hypothetical protein
MWAVGLIVVLVTAFFGYHQNGLHKSVAALTKTTEDGIKGLETRMAGMETKLETRMAGMETRMAGLETKLETRMAGMETRMAGMEAKFEFRIGGMESRFDTLAKTVGDLRVEVANKLPWPGGGRFVHGEGRRRRRALADPAGEALPGQGTPTGGGREQLASE